jgi:hypothetical protein
MIRDIIQQQQLRGAALGGRYAMNRQAGRQAGRQAAGAARRGWAGVVGMSVVGGRYLLAQRRLPGVGLLAGTHVVRAGHQLPPGACTAT